jgi:hypothetical protein
VKHVVATWKGKTGTIPAFAPGPRKTKKNLCQYGRSQDLPATKVSTPTTVRVTGRYVHQSPLTIACHIHATCP